MEAVEDQQREPDRERQAGHGPGRDADRVELDHVAEQRHLAEPGQHADRADGGHEQRRDRRPQPDQRAARTGSRPRSARCGGGSKAMRPSRRGRSTGWPVTNARTGAVIRARRGSRSAAGRSGPRRFSERSTDTTIIAAVGSGAGPRSRCRRPTRTARACGVALASAATSCGPWRSSCALALRAGSGRAGSGRTARRRVARRERIECRARP